jgi:hypothetical protein
MGRPSLGVVLGTFYRLRLAIAVMAAIYLVSVSTGIVMASRGDALALGWRDTVVRQAHASDPAAIAYRRNNRISAAALDFSRNLLFVAVPDTVSGLTVILPPISAAYRGWLGGIVSVDGHHQSRLRTNEGRIYYFATLALQISGFILSGAAGLNLGIAFFRCDGPFVGPSWLQLPRPALLDALRAYLAVIPLLAVGSAWEFLSPLN